MNDGTNILSRTRLGVDLGNVLIDHTGFGTTTDYVLKGNYMEIPPVPFAVATIQHLLLL